MSLLDNLISYYKLDEASGNALDAHNGHDGVATNNPGSGSGKINTSRTFAPASDQYFTNTSSAFSFPSTDFTIQAWINPTSFSGADVWGRGAICYTKTDQIGDWIFGGNVNDKLILMHWQNTGDDLDGRKISVNTISLSTWSHYIARKSGATYTLWLNGVSEAFTTDRTGHGWDNIDLNIGKSFSTSAYHWNGSLDEIGIWDRALSDSEIGELWNAGAGLAYPFAGGGIVLGALTAVGQIHQATLSQIVTTPADLWGLLIARSQTSGFSPSKLDVVGSEIYQASPIPFVDRGVQPGTYYYRTSGFSKAGLQTTWVAQQAAIVS